MTLPGDDMGDGPTVITTSPWAMEFGDYLERKIGIEVFFNETTKVVTGARVYRDADCLYKRVFIGLGTDGSVETTLKKFNVPSGTTNISGAALAANGLAVVDTLIGLQITAGP